MEKGTTLPVNNSQPKITKSGLVFLRKAQYERLKRTADAVENCRAQFGEKLSLQYLNGELVLTIPKPGGGTDGATSGYTGTPAETGGVGGGSGYTGKDQGTPPNPDGEAEPTRNDNGADFINTVGNGGGVYQEAKDPDGDTVKVPTNLTYDADGNAYIDGYPLKENFGAFNWKLLAGLPNDGKDWCFIYPDAGFGIHPSIYYSKSEIIQTSSGPATTTCKVLITIINSGGDATLKMVATGDNRIDPWRYWAATGGYSIGPENSSIGAYGIHDIDPICTVPAKGGTATYNINIGPLGYWCGHSISLGYVHGFPAAPSYGNIAWTRTHPGFQSGSVLVKFFNEGTADGKKLQFVMQENSLAHSFTLKALSQITSNEYPLPRDVLATFTFNTTQNNPKVSASSIPGQYFWISELYYPTLDVEDVELGIEATSRGFNSTYDSYEIEVVQSTVATSSKALTATWKNKATGGISGTTASQYETDESS